MVRDIYTLTSFSNQIIAWTKLGDEMNSFINKDGNVKTERIVT